ncbi:MAG: hypothetical protein GVY12_02005 [Bacteroidetes bacterium]|nr:hypothetical protein [Bacteroidota bacterium]
MTIEITRREAMRLQLLIGTDLLRMRQEMEAAISVGATEEIALIREELAMLRSLRERIAAEVPA